ncbi:MAG: hypothetical protein ACTH5M_03145, partial [Psychrobacter sp.]
TSRFMGHHLAAALRLLYSVLTFLSITNELIINRLEPTKAPFVDDKGGFFYTYLLIIIHHWQI